MTNPLRLMITAIGLLLITTGGTYARTGNALLLNSDLPGNDPSLAKQLSATLEQAGYEVTEIGASELQSTASVDPTRYDLLVLPNSANLPAASTESIDKYLRGGGDIIALNAPMWQKSLININEKWLTKEEYQYETASIPPDKVFFDFTPQSVKSWERASSNLENPTTWEVSSDSPVPGYNSMHVVTSNNQGWDTLRSPELDKPFPDGYTLTVVTAKGDAKTKQISIEWEENDGSRWIAVINLSDKWRRYVLKPEDFKYWTSNPKRGGQGDKFNPANASRMAIGVAFTHTGFVPGRHEYWIGPVGTIKMTPDIEQSITASNLPVLDTLSPGYKFFSSSDVGKLAVRSDQAITAQISLPLGDVRSSSPRPKAAGFDKNRIWRWIPLIDAESPSGEWRGVPATILVNTDGDYKGGIWASFGIQGSDWYKSDLVQNIIKDIAQRMNNDVFLLDAGSNYYTYFNDQKMILGMRTSNIGSTNRTGLTGKVRVVDNSTGKQVVEKSWEIDVKAGATKSVSSSWKPSKWPEKGFTITAELFDDDGKLIDTAEHEAYVWIPKDKKEFITVENGDYMLQGKRWRANGVNYMPSSGIAMEDGDYFEQWLGSRAYDPEVIERDINHMKDIGLNSVSIFIYHQSIKAQNLLDLLRRLDNHGMKVNLSLRPGTPMNFLWPQIKEIIDYYRLKDNDTVYAYDVAWEPWHGNHDARKAWDGEWEAWIIERYGSIANAERDWGYKVPRDDSGKITNPYPQHFHDGEWKKMTAAYRRFLDTLLYEKYSAARSLIKGVDPNHLVSFRMSEAGNPTFKWDESLPYDFPYLATAVDILEPEGYGRIGEWENVKPGIFEYEYARWAAPTKPMMWAEAGYNAWDMSIMDSSRRNLDFQGRYLNDFYKMLIISGADGVYFWWYPGGFRYGENSDYGIINPDGTDRPATKAIRENGVNFINGPSAKPVDVWLEMDRDEYPMGIGGVYDSLKDEFWNAFDQGKRPGLRTRGTGTNSMNCPLDAVGNSIYNGTNPLKYLDTWFDKVEIRNAGGKWRTVPKGGSIEVDPHKSIEARISLTNLGEAALLAAETQERGSVWVTINGRNSGTGIRSNVPYQGSVVISEIKLPDVERGSQITVTLGMEAVGRARFGQKYDITLIAK